jgi:hypothetical protein
MFGRDIFVEALEREGVEVIFAYPGGASMELHQSLTKSKIRTILPRHEQGGSSPRKVMPAPPARPACAWAPAAPARRISSRPSPMPTWIPARSIAITGSGDPKR